MTGTCAHCGMPSDRVETHHVNHQKGDNNPDNLSPRDRRCHMEHHDNPEAVTSRFGPPRPSVGPA